MAARRSQWVLEVSTPQYGLHWAAAFCTRACCGPPGWMPQQHSSINCCLRKQNQAWLHGPPAAVKFSTELEACLLTVRCGCKGLLAGSSAQHLLTQPICATAWWGRPPCLFLLLNGHDTAAHDLSHALPCCTCSVPVSPQCWCSVCHSLSPTCHLLPGTLLICSTLHTEMISLDQCPLLAATETPCHMLSAPKHLVCAPNSELSAGLKFSLACCPFLHESACHPLQPPTSRSAASALHFTAATWSMLASSSPL